MFATQLNVASLDRREPRPPDPWMASWVHMVGIGLCLRRHPVQYIQVTHQLKAAGLVVVE
jgi:hypothetical protein